MCTEISTMTNGKLFFRYVIPSMISMVTAGVYTLVDGLFVGWGVGDAGLAALNVAFPLSLLIVACGEMIGTGGAITISLSRGRGAKHTPDLVLSNMLLLLIPAYIGLLLLLPFLTPVLEMIGGSSELLHGARQYASITLLGGIPMMAAVSLIAVMRNDGAPRRAMAIMSAGLVANIILDWLFVLVWRWGVAGSAWATVLAQLFCCLLALEYFIGGRSRFRFRWKLFRVDRKVVAPRILIAGLPSFGVQLSVAAVILLHNRQALLYGGVAAVAAYAIISYVESTILMLQQGIGLGIQPVVSFLHGAEEEDRRDRIARYGIFAAVGLGVAGTALSVFGARLIPELFRAGDETFQFVVRGLIISAAVYPFLGLQKISEAYFQAMDRPALASLLVYLDCLAVLPASLILLPMFFGTDGIWAAMPVSKIIMTLVALALRIKVRHEAEDFEFAGKRVYSMERS